MPGQGGGKITGSAGQPGYFGQWKNLYIDVPADLDQFRGDNSHGTVIGGEGLVQLGHHTADGRGTVGQVNMETRFRKINGRLHTADPAPDDEYRARVFFTHVLSPI